MWMNQLFQKIKKNKTVNDSEGFDDLELAQVVPKVLQNFYGKFKCDNVIWILMDGLEQNKELILESALRDEKYWLQSVTFQLLKPIGTQYISSIFDFLMKEDHLPKITDLGIAPAFVLPVRHFKTHKVLAYILLIQPSMKNQTKSLAEATSDLQKMSKHITFSIQHWHVQNQTILDDLTGLYNQKYLNQVLDFEILRSQRENKKFSVLFMDVDFFKNVNDTRGHWIGSRLLIDMSTVLKHNVRKTDFAFRYGGDEFVVVLPNTDSQQAMNAAERLRSIIEQTQFLIDGESLKLTLSIGIATFPDHAKTQKEIIKMADEAMYCGKHKSRNIVFVAS